MGKPRSQIVISCTEGTEGCNFNKDMEVHKPNENRKLLLEKVFLSPNNDPLAHSVGHPSVHPALIPTQASKKPILLHPSNKNLILTDKKKIGKINKANKSKERPISEKTNAKEEMVKTGNVETKQRSPLLILETTIAKPIKCYNCSDYGIIAKNVQAKRLSRFRHFRNYKMLLMSNLEEWCST
ncbi:hypothetical protein Tco_1203253 [Tanacetum coccineum]